MTTAIVSGINGASRRSFGERDMKVHEDHPTGAACRATSIAVISTLALRAASHRGRELEERQMTNSKLLTLLTAVNVGLFAYQFVKPQQGFAAQASSPDVLRGRALEIVDDRGRVRASLSVLPEDPKVLWKGKPYPETVLLRLITADGRPNVKLGASRNGAGLLIGGVSDPTYVQVLAEGGETTVKLINQNRAEKLITP